MDTKIQLKHPTAKKAVKMDRSKYQVVEQAILNCLREKGELSHSEILKLVTADFKNNKVRFEGSMNT